MQRFEIQGGNALQGSLEVSSSKNSTLALMAAAALGTEEVILNPVPQISDVLTLSELLRSLGASVRFEENALLINGAALDRHQPPYEITRKIRGSIYLAGLLLARLGQAEVALPGGDEIGSRPVDQHIRGFQALGADITVEHGMLIGKSRGLRGANIFINRSSVGATINLMLAACLASGVTILENPAREPEVIDTAVLLNRMGAKIRGAGTTRIRIDGVAKLSGYEHAPIPDRIEAGTFLIAAAAAGGDVWVTNVIPDHLRMLIAKLREAGAGVIETENGLRITARRKLRAVDVDTDVYPGFATDLQAPFGVLLAQAAGTGIIRENVFDNRFRYVDELRRMGADIKVEHETAVFRGVERLSGAPVEATDIRAGVALVIAGLVAEGLTQVFRIEHIDRGYVSIEKKLRQLGAEIQRVLPGAAPVLSNNP
jgi:UDP-N-acetylglucosamine 1-carboxyvinyltransferase